MDPAAHGAATLRTMLIANRLLIIVAGGLVFGLTGCGGQAPSTPSTSGSLRSASSASAASTSTATASQPTPPASPPTGAGTVAATGYGVGYNIENIAFPGGCPGPVSGVLKITGTAASSSFREPFTLTVTLGEPTDTDTFTVGRNGTSASVSGGATGAPAAFTSGTVTLRGHSGVLDLDGEQQGRQLARHIEYTCAGVSGA